MFEHSLEIIPWKNATAQVTLTLNTRSHSRECPSTTSRDLTVMIWAREHKLSATLNLPCCTATTATDHIPISLCCCSHPVRFVQYEISFEFDQWMTIETLRVIAIIDHGFLIVKICDSFKVNKFGWSTYVCNDIYSWSCESVSNETVLRRIKDHISLKITKKCQTTVDFYNDAVTIRTYTRTQSNNPSEKP